MAISGFLSIWLFIIIVIFIMITFLVTGAKKLVFADHIKRT